MDARNTAGAGAQPTRSDPDPSPDDAARGSGAPAGAQQGTPAEDVEQLAPWEVSGRTDRPPMLPDPQSAPWLSGGAPQLDTRLDEPFEREIKPWETDASAVAPAEPAIEDDRAADGPVGIEVPPWDAPPPFSYEELIATDDPYDAHAPLIEDFEPRQLAFSMVRPNMTAPTAERPVPSIEEVRSSVFGDIFTTPPRPEPAFIDDQPPTIEPPTFEPFAVDQPDDNTAADETAADEQSATPSPDPVNWPPVPTEFPPASAPLPQTRRAADQDPLAWPPIPGDLITVPDTGPRAATVASQPSVWDQPAPGTSDGSVGASAIMGSTDLDGPDLPDLTADVPDHAADTYAFDEGEQPGAVFARFAATGTATREQDEPGASTFEPANESMAVASLTDAPHARDADGDGSLWFLNREPRDSGSPALGLAEDAEPSTIVTLVAMIVVGLIVVGAVTLFLMMFTKIL